MIYYLNGDLTWKLWEGHTYVQSNSHRRVGKNGTEAVSEKTMAGQFPKMGHKATDSKHTYTICTLAHLST